MARGRQNGRGLAHGYGAPGRNTANITKQRHVRCQQEPTDTSCVCCSVLSRSKLQMVAASAARRRDKNDLCLTCVGVVDVATRAALSRSLGVAAHVECNSKQAAVTKQQLLQLEETSGNPATRELNLVGQNPQSGASPIHSLCPWSIL